MAGADALLTALDFLMREAALFSASGFLILGVGDLFIDAVWLVLAGGLLLKRRKGVEPLRVETLPKPAQPGRLAVFTPAWDEAGVIGTMLRHTLATFDYSDYRVYVGCYPNDAATIAEVRAIADERVRLVVGPVPGPTTKADCLNRLWEAMLADERTEGRQFKAVVLHDAEDVVHSAELRIFDALSEEYDLVQLPVVPLIHPKSLWVSGHYADEFAESHAKELVVREALGAAVPSAGVGCAFRCDALVRMAERNGGLPFDADSLTEDYELGLKLSEIGGRRTFARIAAGRGAVVATKEYFPQTLRAAVNQKARWMTGIALSGWDRLGWRGGLAERWMRLRDRQSLLAAVLLFFGYLSFGLWVFLKVPELVTDWRPQPVSELLAFILLLNLAILVWRLSMRFAFVTHSYGWKQGLISLPRVAVSNVVAISAAWHAVLRYRTIRRSGRADWRKTAHAFPAELPAE
ncbi:MAG TPA: glycosyl transferase family protein [Allosphingosinicella sp.]|uniref:glycosyl transferase family protein n=1 Tax=Allosphingosinicella sp. TaxID=2823234 RepID=UPI002EDAB010